MARRGEDLDDPTRCKNCGHSKEAHFRRDAYVPGKCDFQYDLCGCMNYESVTEDTPTNPGFNTEMTPVNELLSRQYIQGSTVMNCVQHMGLNITERPDDCKLCLSDLRNHMNRCIGINEWLNQWKEDATKLLEER